MRSVRRPSVGDAGLRCAIASTVAVPSTCSRSCARRGREARTTRGRRGRPRGAANRRSPRPARTPPSCRSASSGASDGEPRRRRQRDPLALARELLRIERRPHGRELAPALTDGGHSPNRLGSTVAHRRQGRNIAHPSSGKKCLDRVVTVRLQGACMARSSGRTKPSEALRTASSAPPFSRGSASCGGTCPGAGRATRTPCGSARRCSSRRASRRSSPTTSAFSGSSRPSAHLAEAPRGAGARPLERPWLLPARPHAPRGRQAGRPGARRRRPERARGAPRPRGRRRLHGRGRREHRLRASGGRRRRERGPRPRPPLRHRGRRQVAPAATRACGGWPRRSSPTATGTRATGIRRSWSSARRSACRARLAATSAP